MSSASLDKWESERALELDRMEEAHHALGGDERGRRWATSQINQGYAMLLSSHFQGFCRDLHSESIDHIIRTVKPSELHTTLRAEFVLARKLDRGNPNPGNIGADFTRLGIDFWREVREHDARTQIRHQRIESMAEWRNAIAHQDFPVGLHPKSLTLRIIRQWRSSCTGLARSFDSVMARYIGSIAGAVPW